MDLFHFGPRRRIDADLADAAGWKWRGAGNLRRLQQFDSHPSPDGKSIVIVSYDKEEKGHPANKDIALRIVNVSDGKIRVLVNLVGGSGSDNVPDWAPDGTHLAFVSFQMLPPA